MGREVLLILVVLQYSIYVESQLSGPISNGSASTLPPFVLPTVPAVIGNATVLPIVGSFPFATFAPSNSSALPTMPMLGNFTLPPMPTFAPFNLSVLPTLAPLNLSGFPTFAPFNLSGLPTFAPFNLSGLPTMPMLGNFTLPPMPTLPPLNLSGLPTMPMLGNFTLPPLPTLPPLNLSGLPTIPMLGNFTLPPLPTLPPLNLSGLPTIPMLGNFTLPPLPTLPPLNISGIQPVPMSNFTPAATLVPLNIMTLAPVFIGNVTATTTVTAINQTLAPLGDFAYSTFKPLSGNITLPPPIQMNSSTPVGFSFATLPTVNMSGVTTAAPMNTTTMPTLRNFTFPPLIPMAPSTGPPFVPSNFTSVITFLPIITLPTVTPMNLSVVTLPPLAPNATTMSVGTMTPSPINRPTVLPNITCGNGTCNSTQVCARPFNSSEVCITRLSNRRYCADNPCDVGMKCLDNITTNAYTCYMKLDGSSGECLGIKCSPGDICYQTMGQQAKCLSANQVPKCMGPNEEYTACRFNCEATCTNKQPSCMNSTLCAPGCTCIRGYVRIDNYCQQMSACPSTTTNGITCSGAESYSSCKSPCEKNCAGSISDSCMPSITTTVAPCKAGCTCELGYKRDLATGQCVHVRQCYSKTKCGANEEWSKCKSCEPVCGATVNPLCKTCWSGCACMAGFSRSTNGTCTAKC